MTLRMQHWSAGLLTSTHKAVPTHLLDSISTSRQIRPYSQARPGRVWRWPSKTVMQEIRDLGPKEVAATSPSTEPTGTSIIPASPVNLAPGPIINEKAEAASPLLTKTQKRNARRRKQREVGKQREVRKQGLELPHDTRENDRERPQSRKNVRRREKRREARRVQARTRLTDEEKSEVQRRKEEYDAMPRFEQGNVMRSAARRILKSSKSEMGMGQVPPTDAESVLPRQRREEVDALKESIRRHRQRMAKKEAQLEQMSKGQRVTNKAIERRIQGTGAVDARIPESWHDERSFAEQMDQLDAPWADGTKEDWAEDSFMDVGLSRSQETGSSISAQQAHATIESPTDVDRPTKKAFSSVQALALERALAGTTRSSAKERRQRYAQEVIKPEQKRNMRKEGGKSPAQLAIAKFARATARIASARHPGLRYVRAPHHPLTRRYQRRSFHTAARLSRADIQSVNHEQIPSQRYLNESVADLGLSRVSAPEQDAPVSHETPVIDSEVFYQAFKEVSRQGTMRIRRLAREQRGNRLTMDSRHLRQKTTIQAAESALEIWSSLILRWRLEIWHVGVGLREDEIADVGHVTIRRETLARIVVDMNQRLKDGRPRLRSDPLWHEIVHDRGLKDKVDLGRFGLDEEEIFVWWHVRTKYRAHTGSATPLGSTRRQITKMATARKHSDQVLRERSSAISSRVKHRLEEWERSAENIQRELWLFALGVHQSNEGIRGIMNDEPTFDMDEVRAAMAFWQSARDKGRAQTRLSDVFFMMGTRYRVGVEASLQSRLRLLRKVVLERDRSKPYVRNSQFGLEQNRDKLLAQSTQPVLTTLLDEGYSHEHRLVALERSITTLVRQVDDMKVDFFSIVTGLSLEDPKTLQYISMPTLRAAIEEYSQVNPASSSEPGAENAITSVIAAQSAYGRVRRRERKPVNTLVKKLRIEIDKAIEKRGQGAALRLKVVEIARKYNNRMSFWARVQLKGFKKRGMRQTSKNYDRVIELEREQMVKMFVQCGFEPEEFAAWGTHLAWKGKEALAHRAYADFVQELESQKRLQGHRTNFANAESARRVKDEIRSRAALTRIAQLRNQVRARAALEENKRELQVRPVARVAAPLGSDGEQSHMLKGQSRSSEAKNYEMSIHQIDQHAESNPLQQLEQSLDSRDHKFGPGGPATRRLALSNRPDSGNAIRRPLLQNIGTGDTHSSGIVRSSRRLVEAENLADDGPISTAALRRFKKGRARYIAQLEAAERSIATFDSAEDDDIHDDELFDFPHEADTRSLTESSPFKPTQRLLAPLKKVADIDEQAPRKSLDAKKQGKLTHLDASGEARMVSVAAKPDTKRVAIAVGKVCFSNVDTHTLVTSAALKKGDVLAISRIAGIQAAKMCPSIIPLCHPIMISSVKVDVVPFRDNDTSGIDIEGMVECTGPTGVEMEALTAVMGAALTVIDMVKAVDKAATIEGVKVVHKSGGKSGTWVDEDWRSSRE